MLQTAKRLGHYNGLGGSNLGGSNFGGLFSSGKRAVRSAGAAAQRADKAIQEAQGAIRQGREILSTVDRATRDLEEYLKRIQNIPIEELVRRFDFKSKIAIEEMLSLSSFMKKSLLYLAGLATLSIYLNILTKK